MKCISKTIEYNVIKCDGSPEFYMEVGKYLNENEYEIKEIDNPVYMRERRLVIKIEDIEIQVKAGHYILKNKENGIMKYITEEQYKNEYVEIK